MEFPWHGSPSAVSSAQYLSLLAAIASKKMRGTGRKT
jgi:hypothetical protein